MQIKEAVGKPHVYVWKSRDPKWPHYAVGEPNKETKWFATQSAAILYATERATAINGKVMQR